MGSLHIVIIGLSFFCVIMTLFILSLFIQRRRGKRTKEKGCLSYDIFCDLEDNHVFSLIEEWETREDLDHHIRSERFSVLLGTRSLLAKPLEMKIHTVSHSEGVEVINALKGKEIYKNNF